MSARPLADDLARALDGEPFGLSCRELASRLHRRLGHVVVALEGDPRFEHHGRGRGSRWRLIAWEPIGRDRERTRSVEAAVGGG